MLRTNSSWFLSKYQRRKAAEGETITNSNTLVLHDGSYTITITSDSIEIDNLLEELKLQLLLVNAGATLLVILNIWFLFQRFAIRHLHQEMRLRKIAEDKLKLLERG